MTTVFILHDDGRDRMIVEFTTTSAISAYHIVLGEMYTLQHYVIKFVSDL